MSSNLRRLTALLALLVTACQPAPVATPLPTPEVWTLQYTPALAWLGPELSACMAEQPGASLLVFEQPAAALEPAQVDFALRWGAPAEMDAYAAVAGWDELVMIVHPGNNVESLSLAQVTSIYTGSVRTWGAFSAQGGRIHLWVYPAGNEVMDAFEGLLGDALQSDAVLNLAPDPSAMLQAVAEDPGAIGFVPRRWLDGSVRPVAVHDAGEEQLRLPILALSAAEPRGNQRAWLLCLQERLAGE